MKTEETKKYVINSLVIEIRYIIIELELHNNCTGFIIAHLHGQELEHLRILYCTQQ